MVIDDMVDMLRLIRRGLLRKVVALLSYYIHAETWRLYETFQP